jgi:hypothetical protein
MVARVSVPYRCVWDIELYGLYRHQRVRLGRGRACRLLEAQGRR